MAKKSLKDRSKEFSILLPFMEGREKADLKNLIEETVTINDFGFLKDEKGQEYVAFTTKEDTEHFYFGGMVLTQNMQELEADGYGEEIRKDGLPVKFGEKRSKNKMTYTTVEFYPEG